MTECIVIQIGNSDDKLTQREWSSYANRVAMYIDSYKSQHHFSGTSNAVSPWQNACFVFDIPTSERESLIKGLRNIATEFRQESIAIMTGTTEFIRTGMSNGEEEKQS